MSYVRLDYLLDIKKICVIFPKKCMILCFKKLVALNKRIWLNENILNIQKLI